MTTVQNLDSFLNITSEFDWLEIIKSKIMNNEITKDTEIQIFNNKSKYEIFDMKNRRFELC